MQPAVSPIPPLLKADAATLKNDANQAHVTGKRLKLFIERIERLEEEKKGLASDIRDVYAEAKGTGFDAKIMRKIVALRKLPDQARTEQDELLDLYKSAIGMY
jgi:uncharacterized protein (UPF0335 family)